MLRPKITFTGARFIRLLRHQNIQLSVFAVKAQVDYAELSSFTKSDKKVPNFYLTKLTNTFTITESDLRKFGEVA